VSLLQEFGWLRRVDESRLRALRLSCEISPIYFATAQVPPILIIHGVADPVVPLQQGKTVVQRAKATGEPKGGPARLRANVMARTRIQPEQGQKRF
jgi:acetyl esterase/lipase